jgi:hypothetical protein
LYSDKRAKPPLHPMNAAPITPGPTGFGVASGHESKQVCLEREHGRGKYRGFGFLRVR